MRSCSWAARVPRFLLRMEGCAYRRGKSAMRGPARRKRQPAEAAMAPSEQGEQARRERRGQAIKTRAAGEEGPQPEPGPHRGGRKMPLALALAPRAHPARPRNAHPTDFLAASPES